VLEPSVSLIISNSMGVDVAGVIETMGESVVSWNLGDQVFYHTTWRKDGSYAEFNVAPAHTFARVPEGISFVDAATLPCAALTAYCALYRRLHVREGDIVLVHAAAGGVGGFTVQLAKVANETLSEAAISKFSLRNSLRKIRPSVSRLLTSF
jgi:NADPH2:quinone reductase